MAPISSLPTTVFYTMARTAVILLEVHIYRATLGCCSTHFVSLFLSNTMRSTRLHFLTLLTVLALVSSQGVSVRDRGCVSSFRKAAHQFEICKTRLCFVILTEKPYVLHEPGLPTPQSRPFKCLGYSNYSGVFFDVVKETSKSVPEVQEAMCIYGGPSCSFDNSLRFIEEAVQVNPKYRFIAGGFFLFMPHRRTSNTIHSQPWLSERMVVLVRQDSAKRSFKFAWKQVFQPYSREGWGILLGLVCLFCIALGIHAYRFSQARTFHELIRWFALSRPSERGVWETASWTSLRLAVVVFFAVSILLYEVSYLILSDTDNISNVEEFRSLGLNNYAVVEGDASETIFRYAVGWENKTGNVPWAPVKTLDDAVDSVEDKTVKYAFSFESTVATMLRRDNLCEKIYPIPMVKRYSGGWYYGISIPRQLRQKIDQALAVLVLEDLPRKSSRAFGVSQLNCGNLTGELDYKVLLFILLLTVGPILLKHIGALILSSCWPDIENPDSSTDAELNVVPDPIPEECIPPASSSNSSSSQVSQISHITKNNSSTIIDVKAQ